MFHSYLEMPTAHSGIALLFASTVVFSLSVCVCVCVCVGEFVRVSARV